MVPFHHGALRWLTMQLQESCSCPHQPMLHKHQKPPSQTVLPVLCGCHLSDVSRLPLPHSHQHNTWICMGITPLSGLRTASAPTKSLEKDFQNQNWVKVIPKEFPLKPSEVTCADPRGKTSQLVSKAADSGHPSPCPSCCSISPSLTTGCTQQG